VNTLMEKSNGLLFMGRHVITDPNGFTIFPSNVNPDPPDIEFDCPHCNANKTNINEWDNGEYFCMKCGALFQKPKEE